MTGDMEARLERKLLEADLEFALRRLADAEAAVRRAEKTRDDTAARVAELRAQVDPE